MMRRQSVQRRQSFLLILLIGLIAVCGGEGDWFEALDANHDGNIDRQEYNDGVQKLQAALNGPIPVGATSSTGPGGFTFPSSLSSIFNWDEATKQSGGGFWKGTTSSFVMILATEIGDKTFFIAAVLSMRQDRSMVFGGAILALIVMTVLSTMMGLVLPSVLPKQYTHFFGGILFLYFGVKLVYESRQMQADKVSEELEEVEEELLHPKKDERTGDEEEGETKKKAPSSANAPRLQNMSPAQVFVQSFTLTFLAEWGDRSQIATIALAAANNPYGVTLGGCLGHSLCTGLAVLGGRMLAARISEKTVSFYGGIIFLGFGLHSIFFETE